MTRKKVKLAFIVNDSARKATYKKRIKGLLKKVDELTTLCGIEACAIVYSPYDPEPEVWPTPWEVQRVLAKFKNMPELEQSKKMVNQETFLKQRILTAKEQVKKIRKDNREKEMTQFMFQCLGSGRILHNNITLVDLNDLVWLIDQNLKDIGRTMETLNKGDQNMNQGQGGLEGQMTTPTPTSTLPLGLLAVTKSETITPVDHENNGLEMNNFASTSASVSPFVVADNMPRNWFMDLINGNGDETMPFGGVNLQSGLWPNPLLP